MADGINLEQQGTLPPELYAQQQALNRQQQMAAMLMQQNQQPQGQMVSGRYVPTSFFQNLQPVANMLTGAYLAKQGDTKAAELAQALRGKQQEVMQQWANAKTPQEKFALGTSDYAPQQLKAATFEMLKPQKLGEGETIQTLNMGTGGYEPLAQGGQKIAPEVRQSMQFLGINKPLDQLTPQELQAIRNEATAFKKAGAPSTTVTMGKSIAGEIGPMMKEAQGITQAAVKTEDSANRIIQAIDSNKLFTGTGANVRLGAAQLANTLGFGGDTLEAKIGNTRQAMQGLAQLTLQGRQQMRGQGAITENESKLAERAVSGEINFTPGEIKQLADAAKRASEYTFNNYQSKLQSMSKNPDTAGLVPYYEVPRMTNDGGWRVK
jgi:hypothetical protein